MSGPSRRGADGVLLQGVTLPFAARFSSNEAQSFDFPVIDFADVTRPLSKGGALDDDFLMRLRVGAVRFEDGSVWRQGEPFNFLQRARYAVAAEGGTCANRGCQALYQWPYAGCIDNPGTSCNFGPCNHYGCNCGNEICPRVLD